MLVSLTLENWKSIRSAQKFDMSASRERRSGSSLAKLLPMYGTRKVLPLAAIYGANASGKTSFVDALSFIKFLVVQGVPVDHAIPVETYRLDRKTRMSPMRFSIEMLIDDRIYLYEVVLNTMEVLEERLRIERTRSYEIVFERDGSSFVFGSHYESERNHFIAQGTRANQLFLHNAISQNANEFRPAYDWFAQTLVPLGLDAQYGSYYSMLLRDDFREFIDEKLRRYRTGVSRLELKTVTRESLNIPGAILDQIISSIPADRARFAQLRITTPDGPEIYIIDATGEEPAFQKVELGHRDADGNEIEFDLSQESTGTQRLIEILPLFFELASNEGKGGRVYVVDELDRSFHTELTDDLVRTFIGDCNSETRNQLIFTTHDLLLMQDDKIRHDEQWVFENSESLGTTFTCIGKHPGVRSDTSLLLAYKSGVFGGYPTFGEQ